MRAKTIGGEGSSTAETEPVGLKFVSESQIVLPLTGPQSLTLSFVSNCCSTTHVPLTRLSFLFDPNQRKDKVTRSGPATEARTAAVDCSGRNNYSRPGRLAKTIGVTGLEPVVGNLMTTGGGRGESGGGSW